MNEISRRINDLIKSYHRKDITIDELFAEIRKVCRRIRRRRNTQIYPPSQPGGRNHAKKGRKAV